MRNHSTERKKKNVVKMYLTIGITLAAIVGAILVGIEFWPEENVEMVGASTSSVEDDPNYKAGLEFMEKIEKEPGIESLGAGIFYKVLKAGNGAKPGQDSKVRVHYEGRLVDGTVFDSSYERKEPATFPVSGVIMGWQIALKAMPVGSTWEVYIPQYYGYGAQGSGKNIPPYSALIFKVELLGIE